MKTFYTSTLAFDIAQFFSSLNHQLLPIILNKVSFDSKISQFLFIYLIKQQTQYIWNHLTSLFFKANVDVGQRSILFPILSALYIASIFYIFEKRTKNLLTPIPVSILSFVNDGLFVSWEKCYKNPNVKLIASFHPYSTNSSWLSNMTNQKSSTS